MFRGARCLVALNIENVVAIIARTIRLQLKFTPLRTNFATLTLVLIFYAAVSPLTIAIIGISTYQVFRLLFLRKFLMLLQNLLFAEGWAQRVVDLSSWSTRYLHSTL